MEQPNNRAQMGMTNGAVKAVIAIALAALLFAFLMPVALNAMEGTQDTTIEQEENVEYEVIAALNSTATDVSQTNSDVTVELNATGESTQSNTINDGENATYTFDRGDVTVTVDSIANDTHATLSYEYPRDFSYSDGARSLWGLVALSLVLAGILFFVSLGLTKLRSS